MNNIVRISLQKIRHTSDGKNALKYFLYMIDDDVKLLVVGVEDDMFEQKDFFDIRKKIVLLKIIEGDVKGSNKVESDGGKNKKKATGVNGINERYNAVCEAILPDVVLVVGQENNDENEVNLCKIKEHSFLEISVKSLDSMSFRSFYEIFLYITHWQDIKKRLSL